MYWYMIDDYILLEAQYAMTKKKKKASSIFLTGKGFSWEVESQAT